VPGFDVLRVEPDGSTVIAGRAQPNTKLEIVNGETVVGTADVGATGDFAAIFDKPLPAGDYQLTLRSVGENGVTKSSEEVATVSIPKDKTGELLAMVSKPGEASRIITKPVADATTAASGQVAKVEPSPATAETSTGIAKPADTAVSTQATGDVAAAAATGDKSIVGVSAVEIEGKKIFVAGNAKAGALVRIYADDTLVGETKTDEQGRFVVDGTIELPVGNHTIRADMMGADGSKVELRAAVPFDRPVGDQVAAVAQGNAQGSVVPFDGGSFDGLRLEATKALSLLKGLFAGGKVPTAEELAAARSATEIALKSLADFKVADNLDANVKEMAAKTATAATDALTMLKALPKDAASVSASLGKIETAVGSALMPRTDGTGNDAVASQTATPAPAQDAVAAAGTAPAESGDAAKPATAETAQKPAVESTAPAAESGTAAAATGNAAAATGQASAEPETVQQAPLQQSKTSVIIRRGDTLWQISRRVYGAGVRYTTIYLANEDQITDPDRILPGQIFGVPDKAMSEAESEEIHRKHVKHLP
jgi:nucleoid-associated protein YgaU